MCFFLLFLTTFEIEFINLIHHLSLRHNEPTMSRTPTANAHFYQDLIVRRRPTVTERPEFFGLNLAKIHYHGLRRQPIHVKFFESLTQGTGSNENTFRAAWFAKDWYKGLKRKYNITSTVMIDGHCKPIEGRKPDCVHYIEGFSPSVMVIPVVGDLRRPRDGSPFPSDDARGRVLRFCKFAHNRQHFRQGLGIYGYLSDGEKIVFYLYRADYNILESPLMPLAGVGGLWLISLLLKTKEQFGYTNWNVTFKQNPLFIEDFLGSGGSADVLKCRLVGFTEKVALKVFKYPEEKIERERDAIDYFHRVPNFPKDNIVSCIGMTDRYEALILSPVATDITTLNYFPGYTHDQLLELIDVIEAIHFKKQVFRDIRPQNILIKHDLHIMLSDFGSIVNITQGTYPIPYSGTSKYASGRILDLLSIDPNVSIEPQYADDIESVLKVIYVSVMRRAYGDLRKIHYSNYAGIRDFWRPRMTAAVWANKVTFTDLRTLIDDLGY